MNDIKRAPGPRYAATLQLMRVADVLWNASRLFFQCWDLSPSQFNILNLLADAPEGVSQIELSRLLIMHRSNVTGLIDRLEKRGLLARCEVPGDRRAYRIVLTPAGKRLLIDILPAYYRSAEEVWGAISAREASRLSAQLANVEKTVLQIAANLQSANAARRPLYPQTDGATET